MDRINEATNVHQVIEFYVIDSILRAIPYTTAKGARTETLSKNLIFLIRREEFVCLCLHKVQYISENLNFRVFFARSVASGAV